MNLPIDVIGMAWICRMCEHLAEAVENGGDICGRSSCGGPTFGKSFPDYQGPLSAVRDLYCFRCGETSDKIIEIGGKGRLGLCKDCYPKVFQEK